MPHRSRGYRCEVMDEYTTAVETGIERRKHGRRSAEQAIASLAVPDDHLEALAFWGHLADLAAGRIPTALASAAEEHEWPTIGAVLAVSATSAAQRHRRHQAKRNAQ